MAQFSSSDISDAKMRVQEMRRRAKNYVDENGESSENNAPNIPPVPQNTNTKPTVNNNEKISPAAEKEDDSFALVLALILVLSNEHADNMLILALLYILL